MAGSCAQSSGRRDALGDKTSAGTKADGSLPLWGMGAGVLVSPLLSCWCELPRSRHKVSNCRSLRAEKALG